MEVILKMESVTKRFGTLIADDCVNFDVRKGEIHSLLGENGAGKSTLMNCLYGLYKPEEGHIYFENKKVDFHSAKDAIDIGIGMIHQHFMLVPVHTVLENIIMGMKKDHSFVIDKKKSEKKILEIANKYGMDIPINDYVSNISVGTQQRVEIVKALYRGAKLLIMDEPTAVLTPQETKDLFKTLKIMSQNGMSIILITHKLNEVLEVSDRVTVLRDGKVIDVVNTNETNEMKLTKLMIGRDIKKLKSDRKKCFDETILSISNLSYKKSNGVDALKNINLTVKKGEILGIAGVDGNGQNELAEAITGLIKNIDGEIRLLDNVLNGKHIKERTNYGIGYIPEDRHRRGLVLDFSVSENIILQVFNKPPFAKNMFFDFEKIDEHSNKMIEEYNIKTLNKDTLAKKLSGGNQQKIVVAREIDRKPILLIAMQPTRGVDIGAIEFIHGQILKEREKGTAVLLISTEITEINALSDRIAVLHSGEIMGIIDKEEFDENLLGLMMAGQPLEDARIHRRGLENG
ncbi:ABC transporter ATP-binding protein [Helicovermis profundi]|uniref:ABC transporter ATP-binding protein n=1 Tax=Helicovermis profundi TaxID=3065157 RepID=A0AAU9E4U3_9FIRM|nr:ABC transporter ATP-binding protein [Clostridia bacterium S502]